jgi:prepilin-type N-terminal cleavage/methylation domain-containing protein
MRGKTKKRGGFTLTELMVVVAIFGIVMAATIPSAMRIWRRPSLDHAGNAMAGKMRICRQRAVWQRTPYRIIVRPAARDFYSERRDTSGIWVVDPPDTFHLDPGIDLSVSAGGSGSNTDIVFEARGTVAQADAPATVLFWNDRAETLAVQLIRTGRVRIQRRG